MGAGDLLKMRPLDVSAGPDWSALTQVVKTSPSLVDGRARAAPNGVTFRNSDHCMLFTGPVCAFVPDLNEAGRVALNATGKRFDDIPKV